VSLPRNPTVNLKFEKISDAIDHAIAVFDEARQIQTGRLIPVGEWILSRTQIISTMTLWNQTNPTFSPMLYEPTFENTVSFLKSRIHKNAPSILFMLTDLEFNYQGHMSFSNLHEDEAKLDGFKFYGDPIEEDRIVLALKVGIKWLKSELTPDCIKSYVVSSDYVSQGILEKTGFNLFKSYPLKISPYENWKSWKICQRDESNTQLRVLEYTVRIDHDMDL
jgi:hypothetical protein